MSSLASRLRHGLSSIFRPRRLRTVLIASGIWGLVMSLAFEVSTLSVVVRTLFVGLSALLVFGLFELWPRQLPAWLARWVLQVVGVAVSIPLSVALYYIVTTEAGAPPFWEGGSRLMGFVMLTVTGMLFAPWVAMAALLRQRDESVRSQALAFERERTRLEQAALDSRLHLLQAQVRPHFLFNTLANVRELVESRSPRAPAVLDSLVAYLRASVPRLDEPGMTLGQELALVRAYLELMQMRMPDRLEFSIRTDPDSEALRCPPLTLMTLVENAVRHGIDPSEEGGTIDIDVRVQGQRCRLRVSDSGVGMRRTGNGPGTGLSSLRERLQLAFHGDAALRLYERKPNGLVAEVELPVQRCPP
jgi:LytS/YehU family sensor histidine kinase